MMSLHKITILTLGLFLIMFAHAQNTQDTQDTQNTQDTTRHIWDSAFLPPKAKKSAHDQSAGKAQYTILTPKVPFQKVDPSTVVGITVWRLRELKKGDGGERLLTHDGAKPVELEPKRVSAQTLFKKDDKVRITVEAAREGYLYVVDRERYSNGKLGEPYLIFPSSTIRHGENHIGPGQIVEFPAQDDDPPYFGIKKSRPDQIGEQLTVMVSPTAFEDISPKESPQRLSPEQCAKWEKDSQVEAGMAEITGTRALGWSKEEKDAGRDPALRLPADAPLPQTLFYSPEATAQSPTIVKLVLNYAPSGHPLKHTP